MKNLIELSVARSMLKRMRHSNPFSPYAAATEMPFASPLGTLPKVGAVHAREGVLWGKACLVGWIWWTLDVRGSLLIYLSYCGSTRVQPGALSSPAASGVVTTTTTTPTPTTNTTAAPTVVKLSKETDPDVESVNITLSREGNSRFRFANLRIKHCQYGWIAHIRELGLPNLLVYLNPKISTDESTLRTGSTLLRKSLQSGAEGYLIHFPSTERLRRIW